MPYSLPKNKTKTLKANDNKNIFKNIQSHLAMRNKKSDIIRIQSQLPEMIKLIEKSMMVNPVQ